VPQDEEPELLPSAEELLKPMGANILAILVLPHLPHLILAPLSPVNTISDISLQASHL